MSFEIQTPPERVATFMASGLWPNRLLTDYLEDAVTAHPDRTAIVGYVNQTGIRLSLIHI